ncbi:GmrSD restriction endonuclease domain-containing protein [Hymenobacter tenuis]
MNYRDPRPDIQRIEELVTGVKNGDIRLPKFQRPFVWKRKEVLRLMDSIYNGYPVGSILLWYTSEKLASERAIGDLEISNDEVYYPTNYILDGQQRLSSLCGALYWSGTDINSIWNVAFDLDKEEFIHPKDELRIEYFPLNKLLNTSDFINQCKSFEAHPKRDKFYKNAENLLRSIKDYKIAVVRIGDITIHEVAPIFERINSTGRKLTIVDLMRAATWKGGFDLNDAINTVKNTCEALDYYDIPDNHILRNISSCAGLGINREDIDKLRLKSSNELENASKRCAEAYSKSIKFLKSKLPLPTYSYLPYGLQLTFLVEFFNIQQKPSLYQEEEIVKWFWTSAFSRHFGTSNTGQNARDLDNIRSFAKGTLKYIPIEREVILDRLLYDDFKLNIANSKTFALLLASKNPRSLTTGIQVDLSEILSVVNRHEFHHIIPPQLFPEYNLNICINICILNKKEAAPLFNQRPANYFNNIINKFPEELNEILDSNFINSECIEALLQNDIDRFFSTRKEVFKKEVENLIGRKINPSTGTRLEADDEDDDIDL